MQLWLNFWNFLFWFSMLGFLINSSNFLFLFLFSEATWLILYTYSTFLGIYLEDLNLISTTFFILGLAGLEFAIGFLLLILFKNFSISYNVIDNTNVTSIFNKESNKNFNILNFFWIK